MATTPYPFVANSILTASQLNSTFNIPVSTKTASYTLVAADAGTRVVMNSASATTITVNTSLFAAGDNLQILNIGAGVCTVTAGTATVSTSGTLALVANAGGTLYFTSAAVSVFQATGVVAAAGGLVFIKSQTIGTTVSSVEVTSAFSATYDNYQIMVSGGAASASGTILLQLGATTTGYYTGSSRTIYNAGGQSLATSNGSSFTYAGHASSNGLFTTIQLLNPQLATRTTFSSQAGSTQTNEVSQFGAGFLDNATQYTAFTLLPTSGTFTGGTIRVYGFANS